MNSKILNRGLILFKREGKIVPQLMIQKIIEAYPSPASFLGQVSDEKGNPFLHFPDEAAPPDLKEIMEMQEQAKDNDVYFYFTNLSDKTPAQNYQPFMVGGDDSKFMSIMVEGDFPQYEGSKTGDTPEYLLTEKIIIPTLKDILELSGDDVDKFAEKLKGSQLFENVLMREIGNRGVCTIVINGHDGITFGKNELSLTEDWGWSSQELGFKAESEQAPVEEVKKSPVWNLGKKSKPAVAEKKDESLPPGVHRISENKPAVPTVAPPKEPEENVEEVKVPDSLHGKARKQYIRKALGLTPAEHLPYTKEEWTARGFVIKRKKTTVVKDFKDIPKSVGSASPKTETAVATVKDAATKVEAAKVTAMQDTIKAVSDPSAADVKEVREEILGYLTAVTKEKLTPNDIQMLEGNVKLFSEIIGCKTTDLLFMPKATIGSIVAKHPDLAARLIMELRKNWVIAGNVSLKDLAGTSEEATNEPAKVEAKAGSKWNLGKKTAA